MIDYQVIMMNFKNGKVKGCATKNDDGSYTIFIEDTLSQEEKEKTLLHELKHIVCDDFAADNVDHAECLAHAM